MDFRLERIAALKESFPDHDYVGFMGAELIRLEMLDTNLSLGIVRAVAKREFMVNSDLKQRKIAQGGASYSIADFAGVYAAMVHTEKHTPLCRSTASYPKPIKEGDIMIAEARASRDWTNPQEIYVQFSVYVMQEEKVSGIFYFHDYKKK